MGCLPTGGIVFEFRDFAQVRASLIGSYKMPMLVR